MSQSSPLEPAKIKYLQDCAHSLRISAIQITEANGFGFPTSCSSIAELIAVLFNEWLRINLKEPLNRNNDRLVLSKGHSAPILYAAWAETGLFSIQNLLNTRVIDSDFEAMPTPRLEFIDVHTGSMGNGLSFAVGMAYMGKYFDKASYRVYAIVGDGELSEGIVWEALFFAVHYNLENLVVIIDINRLEASGETYLGHQFDSYHHRLDGLGANIVEVNGHNIADIHFGLQKSLLSTDKPTVIMAKTVKGKYFGSEFENKENWHNKLLGSKAEQVIKHIRNQILDHGNHLLMPLQTERTAHKIPKPEIKLCGPPDYKLCQKVATTEAYAIGLVKIAYSYDRILALDADTKFHSFAVMMEDSFKSRFIECFVSEQNMIGVAVGLSVRDRAVVFASTFAAYMTKAYDQLRVAAISKANINIVGIDCGVSVGLDGPGRMGLEDLAMFRNLPGSTIFYPADAVSCEYAVQLAANKKGICYIRTSRPLMPVLYKNEEVFEIGKGKVIRWSYGDEVLLIGAGITVHECICAAEELEKNCVKARIIDVFTVKPLDAKLILKHGRACNGRIVVVEDHYKAGGLGEAVLSELAGQRKYLVKHLYVNGLPRSGRKEDVMDISGIAARHIYNAAMSIVNK